MKLDAMLDVDNLARHVAAGTVNETRHPTEPLRLYNYSARCQFTSAWDAESRAARGLIVDDDDNVVARPFPKFHNLHEHADNSHAGPLLLEPPLRVFDKVDGSLGIAYRRPSDGETAWATRGSFASGQAQWANEWWAQNQPVGWRPKMVDRWTFLAEIVYPDNRIVLDYGDRAGLVLLAILDIETGFPWDLSKLTDEVWPGEVVESFGVTDDITTVDRNGRADSEGYVVLSGDLVTRVKLKTDEYMRLHKILTGVSTVNVWEMLANGDRLDVLFEKVPDEFAQWALSTVAELQNRYQQVLDDAVAEFERLRHLLPVRREFAVEALKTANSAVLFRLADGKDPSPLIWKMIRPERTMPYLVEP